ncbi:MAG: TonB-dependent receptor domain-containing protein, partial [Bacillota bacterium]
MRKNKRPATAFAKKSCVTATQVALAMMAAPLVYAQQAEVQKGERIEITGTRIPSPNLESTSPVAVIGAEDIKFEGVRNVESLLNNMPQVFATQGASISNGSTGTATVDLRGLGSARTLVLVNGKRMPAGSPHAGSTGAPDLNQIPTPLIQRVEILTGGASSVYGSDAISGVVNFILRDNFEGVQGEVNYSWYQHDQHNPQNVQALLASRAATNPSQYNIPGDKGSLGESTEASLTLGGNFGGGKGNATLFFGYKKDAAITQNNYDYSECAFGSSATGFTCSGSSTSFPGRFVALTGPNAGHSFTIADAAGNVRPFTTADQFNFAPANFYQRPSERYTFHASGHYDINPHVRAYLDFGFHDDHTVAQIAPSGLFGADVILTGDNPLLSPSFRTAFGLTSSATSSAELLIFRRDIEGGNRQDDIRHTSFRVVGGIKGDVFKNWDYDIYAQTGKVIYQEIYRNEFSLSRGSLALDVITDPATGLPACRSTVTGSTAGTPLLQGCVPYNLFQLGGVNQASLNYMVTPGLQRGSTEQAIQGATLTGDLGNYGWRFPSAKSGIGLAVGVERRVEKLTLDVDQAFATGDLAGQGGPTPSVQGQYTVKEAFGEVRVPIIEGRHMADLLSVNASYRYSDYSTGFTTDTYGIGADFAPVQMVKFRGSYQQATRAPNVIELFTPQAIGLFNFAADPCGGPTPSATAAQCARTGLPANLYGSGLLTNVAGQANALFGGNPGLQPEKSKSYTAGIV